MKLTLFRALFYKPENNTWLAVKHVHDFKWKNLETIEDDETLLLFSCPTRKNYIEEAYNVLGCINVSKENIWLTPIITDTPLHKWSLSSQYMHSSKILFNEAMPL